MDMHDQGFNQKIWVDWTTGNIHGGNRYNCGYVVSSLHNLNTKNGADKQYMDGQEWIV
jgi:hypothetical protein